MPKRKVKLFKSLKLRPIYAKRVKRKTDRMLSSLAGTGDNWSVRGKQLTRAHKMGVKVKE